MMSMNMMLPHVTDVTDMRDVLRKHVLCDDEPPHCVYLSTMSSRIELIQCCAVSLLQIACMMSKLFVDYITTYGQDCAANYVDKTSHCSDCDLTNIETTPTTRFTTCALAHCIRLFYKLRRKFGCAQQNCIGCIGTCDLNCVAHVA